MIGEDEEKLMRQIFGESEPMWRGKYAIFWCDMCRGNYLTCSVCGGTNHMTPEGYLDLST